MYQADDKSQDRSVKFSSCHCRNGHSDRTCEETRDMRGRGVEVGSRTCRATGSTGASRVRCQLVLTTKIQFPASGSSEIPQTGSKARAPLIRGLATSNPPFGSSTGSNPCPPAGMSFFGHFYSIAFLKSRKSIYFTVIFVDFFNAGADWLGRLGGQDVFLTKNKIYSDRKAKINRKYKVSRVRKNIRNQTQNNN